MVALRHIREILSLNYDYIALLFDTNTAKLKRAENGLVKLPPDKAKFALWLHKESLCWMDAKFCADQMLAAHEALNPNTLKHLDWEYQICIREKEILSYKLMLARKNYAYDLKTYAVLNWLSSRIPEKFRGFEQLIDFVKRKHSSMVSERRLNRLLRTELQIEYVDAKIKFIERIKKMEFRDPETME